MLAVAQAFKQPQLASESREYILKDRDQHIIISKLEDIGNNKTLSLNFLLGYLNCKGLICVHAGAEARD
jgi:hypothetical protein